MSTWSRFLLLLAWWMVAFPSQAAITVLRGTADSCQVQGLLGLFASCGFTLNAPSGATEGDVLIAQIIAKASETITAPSGWTRISPASGVGTSLRQHIYYRYIATGQTAGSATWQIDGPWLGLLNSGYATGVMYAARGAENPDCASATTFRCGGTVTGGVGTSVVAPSMSLQYPAGSLRMAFFASNSGTASITPALENSATAGVYNRAGGSVTGVGLHGSYYLLGSDSNGGQQSANLNTSSYNIGSTFILRAAPVLTCVSDNFNRSTGLGNDWSSVRVAGDFTPQIVNNRLRLTAAVTNQSTGVSFQRVFPSAGNYLQLVFRFYGYGGGGADGVALILSDASVTPQPGGFGGSLGYAPKSNPTVAGFAGGWLGIGLDEYGNFSSSSDSGPCAPGVTCSSNGIGQSLGIRGASPNYYWLRGTGTLSPTVSNSSGHLYRVTIDSRMAGKVLVSIERDTGSGYSTLVSTFDAAPYTGQSTMPAQMVFSLTGSTGETTNVHEIDDVQVCASSMSTMQAQIDHYRFSTTSTPLTCTPAQILVQACMDANCSTTYSGNVTATLTPSGWVGGDTRTFAGSGATLGLTYTLYL